MKNNFARDIAGFSFIAAALMFWGGYMLLPVHINIYFTPEDILTIQGDLTMYLWMYRVHIFGMIITIAAMSALGTVFPQTSSRVLVNPGLAVISIGMAATSLGSAFFYQFGTSGAYDLLGMPLEAVREFIASLKLDTQYAGCFMRFGRVFTGLGMVILGTGLWKSKVLPSWTGITAIIIGIAAMAVIIVVPTSDLFYIPVLHLKALWLAVMGITILRSQISFPAPNQLKERYNLPSEFGMFSTDENNAIRSVIKRFLPEFISVASKKGLDTPLKRLSSFQNENVETSGEGNYYDDFFGYIDPGYVQW